MDDLGIEFYVPDSNKGNDCDTIQIYGSIAIHIQTVSRKAFIERIVAYDFYLLRRAESPEELLPLRTIKNSFPIFL